MLSGAVVWFLGVSVVAICVSVVVVVMMKHSAKSSEGNAEGQAAPQKMTPWLALARLGLIFSSIALLITIYMLPVSLYLPEDISLPTFVYSLLAFPIVVTLGIVLSFLGYIAKRYRSGLTGMIIGGLSVVWLVTSYFVRMAAFNS